jgi:hypothetical protein
MNPLLIGVEGLLSVDSTWAMGDIPSGMGSGWSKGTSSISSAKCSIEIRFDGKRAIVSLFC